MVLESVAALVQKERSQDETKEPTPMQQINEALKECKFGLFHIRILCSSFFGFMSGIMVTNTTPYLLPNAECDLDMNLVQKGILNAIPFIGMILTSVIAGFLTDTFGRKTFIVGSFGGIAVFNVISSFSQTYMMLVVVKFFEGVLFAAGFGASVTLSSEFCHPGIRDRMMILQSSFQSFGQILLACVSWAILTQEWRYSLFNGYIVLNSWNFYLLILSSLSITACVLYSLIPESPKYLLTQHKYEEARKTLILMYKQNTGKSVDTFSYANVWKDKSLQAVCQTPGSDAENKKKGISHMLVVGLHNIKPMFRRPLAPRLALFITMNFFIMVLFNVIRLWFPQLSTIVESYSNDTDVDQDLCTMLDAYTSDLKMKTLNLTVPEKCVPNKSGSETYINSIILGFVCLSPYLLTGVLVNKVGKKYLEMIAGVFAVGCTLGLRWANSKVQVVALFSAAMALGQSMKSLLQATTIEVFPTTTRTLAVAIIMTSGRIGSLVGNVTFPILLDMGCVVPFFTLAGIMTFVTFLTVFLPKKKK